MDRKPLVNIFIILSFIGFIGIVSAQIKGNEVADAFVYASPKEEVTITASKSLDSLKSIELLEKYDKTNFYSMLIENTEQCLADCHAVFEITNKLGVDVPYNSLNINYADKLLVEDSKSVSTPEFYTVMENVSRCIENRVAGTYLNGTDYYECSKSALVLVPVTKKRYVSGLDYFWRQPEKGEVIRDGSVVKIKIEYTRDPDDVEIRFIDWIPEVKLTNPEADITEVLIKEKSWAWWNNSWTYKLPVTVTCNGYSNGWEIRINNPLINYSKFQSMGEDFRIINESGNELAHYTEGWSNTANTSTVWIKSDCAIGATRNYIIYGNNPSATSTSDPNIVFSLYDTFPGTTLNASIWNQWINTTLFGVSSDVAGGLYTIRGMNQTSQVIQENGIYSILSFDQTYTADANLSMNYRYPSGVTNLAFGFQYLTDSFWGTVKADSVPFNCSCAWFQNGDRVHAINGNETTYVAPSVTWTAGTFLKADITKFLYIKNSRANISLSNSVYVMNYSGVVKTVNNSNRYSSNPMPVIFMDTVIQNSGNVQNYSLDWIRVYHENGTAMPSFAYGSAETSTLLITFNGQTPANLTTTNIFSPSVMNVSYNVTTGWDTINIFYNITQHINGTTYDQLNKAMTANNSDTIFFILNDNNVYPATYNINEATMEAAVHSGYSLNTANSGVKVRLFNVSNNKPYNILEFYATNLTITSNSLNVYYCNSSYATGSYLTSPNCVQIYTLDITVPYNHTHSANSKHYLVPLFINSTSNKLNNIPVTDTSYFILHPNSIATGGWNAMYVGDVARADTCQTTTNNGGTWSNFAGTFDLHLHQYNGSEILYYQACGNNSYGTNNCSIVSSAPYNLSVLPPTSPVVFSPNQSIYLGTILINYTAAESPSGIPIRMYNISLLNIDETFNQLITADNVRNLSYTWNSIVAADGDYFIRVDAYDQNNRSSYGLTSNFTIDNTLPVVTLNTPVDGANLSVGFTTFNFTCTDTHLLNASLQLNLSGSLADWNSTTSITSGVETYLGFTMPYGSWKWTVVCYDIPGASDTAATQIINIQTTTTTMPPINVTGRVCTETGYRYILCYQETANVSTACGGLSSGHYSEGGDWMDGNWFSSIGMNVPPRNFSVNYTKPSGAIDNSLIQIKTDVGGIVNYSLPRDCWDYSNEVSLRFYTAPNTDFLFACLNDSSWVQLDNFGKVSSLFEEGMWWNTTTNPTWRQVNLTFFTEETGAYYNMSQHTPAVVDVACSRGSDRWYLNDTTQSFYAIPEVLSLSFKTDDFKQFRGLLMSPPTSRQAFFSGAPYVTYMFKLVDYTSQCTNSNLTIRKSVGDSYIIVHQGWWDINKQQYVSLQNNTPYTYIVDCGDGNIRTFGAINLLPTDTVKNIEINNILLNDKQTDNYAGGITTSFNDDYAGSAFSLVYNKSGGYVKKIRFNVSIVNGTLPYPILYSIEVTNTTQGVLTYVVPNKTQIYYLTAEVTNDNDQTIVNKVLSQLINTARIIDIGIGAEFAGVSQTTMYNAISYIILVGIAMAFTVVNAGLGGMVLVAMGGLFFVLGWTYGMPWWLLTTAGVLAIGWKLAERRDTL